MTLLRNWWRLKYLRPQGMMVTGLPQWSHYGLLFGSFIKENSPPAFSLFSSLFLSDFLFFSGSFSSSVKSSSSCFFLSSSFLLLSLSSVFAALLPSFWLPF
jgi:hypothetical protein